ncbi:hypothetical protein FPV67DRAFT_1505586 [Lyophyllum atratum]|nr:hypothetical protein FPV67DRAFT_1505586 [Lyophyllum atratum]
MVAQKPLPALPQLAELSINARQHRARLIRQFLSDVHESGIETRREEWVDVFEEVLDELGMCLTKGRWLDGVRKWREQQRKARKREREVEGESRRQDTVKAKKQVKTQDKGETVKQAESAPSSARSSIELPPMALVAPKPDEQRFLLCVAPPGTRTPTEDSGFDVVSRNVGCTFTPGMYAHSDAEDLTILFGDKESSSVNSVGGTFTFKGIAARTEYEHLVNVLRLATYAHLGLMLEQQLLADSNITLTFPRPKLPLAPPSAPPTWSTSSTSIDQRIKKPATSSPSFLPPSIFSFFSKSSIGQRASSALPRLGGDHSTPSSPSAPARTSGEHSGGLGSSFRFSILGKKPAVETDTAGKPKTPFKRTLDELEEKADLLSTSPGVRFDPPPLIVSLAERETENGLRLRADERTALGCVLGWEGKSNLARGMTGTVGFVRQQGIEVLEVHRVPDLAAAVEMEAGVGQRLAVCGSPAWRTYRYYAKEDEDVSLGAMVMELSESAGRPCEVAKCQHLIGVHETRLSHGPVRVNIGVEEMHEEEKAEKVGKEGRVEIWESCATCGACSTRREMSDGTYLLSFGKFLELLIYSPIFQRPSSTYCPHTDRFNIRRHFGTRKRTITFACAPVEDVFELRVPALQITRGEGVPRDSSSSQTSNSGGSIEQREEEQEKRELRREIRRWWEGVADYLDKLEAVFAGGEEASGSGKPKSKALPRLPSSGQDYRDEDSPRMSATPSAASSPLRSTVPPAPPSTPAHEVIARQPAVQEQDDPLQRLESLRQTFHCAEQSLYAQLARTDKAGLNDVRRSFAATAKGAEKRLCAWQKKHLNGVEGLEWKGAEEPEWWKPGCHALPGSDVIVREDDLGSIIAFTLSSPDYQRELSNMSSIRSTSTSPQAPQLNTPAAEGSETQHSDQSNTPSSFFSSAMKYKVFTPSSRKQPDPDHDDNDTIWDTPELFSSVISRKEHPRDVTSSLLSIREVLRREQKSPAPDASRFGSLGKGPAPPSAWAKPDVAVSKDEADGRVSAEHPEGAGKILHEYELMSAEASRPTSRASNRIPGLENMEAHIQRGDASSVVSEGSDATVGKGNSKDVGESTRKSSNGEQQPPPPPPKDERHMQREGEQPGKEQERAREVSNATSSSSSLTNTLTSGLSSAMRYMLHSGQSNSGAAADALRSVSPFPGQKAHHGLLSLDAAGVDERPHIKYDWTVGKRLKFSCTVYYAKQFDLLRRRCAVDEIYGRSLRHSENWAAEGGKSRSNFWKTADDRFIIKTLVDAWNVADLQVLIDLGPSYFRYMDTTANRPSVLTKMLGFYTIEVRNLETGAIHSKNDLLVMENVFYNQKVTKTFDLKGIQGRKVKPSSGFKVAQNPKTLYDGEWLEDQLKFLMLVRPHSKHVLHTAVKSDAEFLTKGNIMDYSLLVGVNEEAKVIACGLVDTIGSYTFAKTLEYKAKQGLTSGKEITVIPPIEYQERFVSALEGYFLPCPDKWSKPVGDNRVVSDPGLLPSVL